MVDSDARHQRTRQMFSDRCRRTREDKKTSHASRGSARKSEIQFFFAVLSPSRRPGLAIMPDGLARIAVYTVRREESTTKFEALISLNPSFSPCRTTIADDEACTQIRREVIVVSGLKHLEVAKTESKEFADQCLVRKPIVNDFGCHG